MAGTLGSSCGRSFSAFSSASLESIFSPSWPTSGPTTYPFQHLKDCQVPSEADQPAGAVHHGLRRAARRRRIFPREDGQHVRMDNNILVLEA